MSWHQQREGFRVRRLMRRMGLEAISVYLHELADGRAARRVIGEWMDFYNEMRPHLALDGRTPREALESR